MSNQLSLQTPYSGKECLVSDAELLARPRADRLVWACRSSPSTLVSFQEQHRSLSSVADLCTVPCMPTGASASAVCIAHLQPGVVPRLKYVMEWPNGGGESKVPSCIFYDVTGMARACCAETRDEFNESKVGRSLKLKSAVADIVLVQAADEGWIKVEEFKLLLNPPSIASSTILGTNGESNAEQIRLPVLPPNVTLTEVYADLLTYLIDNAQAWFQKTSFE